VVGGARVRALPEEEALDEETPSGLAVLAVAAEPEAVRV